MAINLIKDLEEREVYMTPTMKAEILQAQRISNDVVAFVDGVGRVITAITTTLKNVVMGNAETGKG